MMDIACDACGKRYRIDETKMKTETAKVKCRACGSVITVSRAAPADWAGAAPQREPAGDAAMPPEPHEAEAGGAGAPAAERAAREPEAGIEPADDTDYQPFVGPQKVRFGIFGKIILVMLLITLLPFGIFWFITFREANQRIQNDTESLMVQTAKGLGDQADDWIKNNLSVLHTAALLPAVVSMNRAEQEVVLKAVAHEYPWMYLVFTLDSAGMNVARNDDQPLKDYSDRQYYKDILAGRAISWQTLIGKTSNVPALVLAVPIKEGGRVIGVLAAAMTVDALSKNIVTWRTGDTGFAFLVDEKGYVIAHPQKQYVETRESLVSHPLLDAFRKKGWTTITSEFRGENGQLVLGHARTISLGWVLTLQQNASEVFASLTVIRNFALALLAITILLVIATSWFSARSLVTPIMKLTEAAERMSLGELNVKIDVQSRDEIGLLAQAIGRMQTSLRMAIQRLRKKR
jgi:methyl-accepting chemotaxis protein